MSRQKFRRLLFHCLVQVELLLEPLLLGKASGVLLEHHRPGIRHGVHRMAHTVDQAAAVKHFPVDHLLQIIGYGSLVAPVGHMSLDVGEHVFHLQVGAAVPGAFQGTQGSRHCRVCIRSGGRYHMGGKGGVVSASVLRVKHQADIQHPGFQLCILAVVPHHPQNVFRCGKLRAGIADHQAFPVVVVLVGVIAVNGNQRHGADQGQGLTQHVGDGNIIRLIIVGIQRQHALLQAVHNVGAGRFHNHVPHKLAGKLPVLSQQVDKSPQLPFVRQFPEQQQISRLLKVEAAVLKAFNQFFYIIPLEVEFTVNGHQLAVHRSGGYHIRNLRQACKHAFTVGFPQPPFHVIFLVQVQVHGRGAHTVPDQFLQPDIPVFSVCFIQHRRLSFQSRFLVTIAQLQMVVKQFIPHAAADPRTRPGRPSSDPPASAGSAPRSFRR